MRKLTAALTLTLFCAASLMTSASVAGEKAKDGKTVFETSKCGMCHSVETAGIAKKEGKKVTDLSKVGAEKKADWIAKYLKKEADLNGKKHGPKFTGTEEDLQALAKWLAAPKAAK